MKHTLYYIYHMLRENLIKKRTVVFIATLFLMISFPVIGFASYIHWAMLNDYTATAEKDFYFTSDLLMDASTIPTYYITHNWTTNAAINFSLRNYENLLQVSDHSIQYTVDTSVLGINASGTIYPVEYIGQKSFIELQVPAPANMNEPFTVFVTASAISPFYKTLHGKFVISPAITYHTLQNIGEPVAVLHFALIQSELPSRTVTISWAEGAAPDMTNSLVLEATWIDLTNRTLITTLNTAATYELVFFKDSIGTDYTDVTVVGV